MANRRQFLQTAGLAAAAIGLAGCDTAPGGAGRSGSTLAWWDHFAPQEKYERKLFRRFAAQKGGLRVDYRVFNPNKQGEALQLAKSSDELPDVFTLAGVNAPPAELRRQGWFSPLKLDDEARARIPADALYDGLTVFGGKTYSFPVLSPKNYEALVWINRDLFDRAGLDPDNPPATYDQWRAAGRAVRTKGGSSTYGWILPLGFGARIRAQVDAFAQAAGAPAVDGRDIRTGEYVYHSEPYVQAIEFLLSMKKDKVLFPASNSLDARTARARWSTGVAGMFLDGCYCVGVVKTNFAAFMDKLAVAPAPVPDGGTRTAIYRPPTGGTYWLSGGGKHVEAASRLMSWFAGAEHQRDIATAMAAPPYLRSAVDKADVHPTYRRCVGFFDKQVYLAPDPVVRNPAVAKVNAAMRDITPDLAAVVQGAFSGDVTNYRKALRTLSDRSQAERERAVATVRKSGQKVSDDDFAFPEWTPRQDFGRDDY